MKAFGEFFWVFVGLGVLALVGLPLMIKFNRREKSVERKWTDPKFHKSKINR